MVVATVYVIILSHLFYLFARELDASQSGRPQDYNAKLTHQSDHSPVFEHPLPRYQAELEHVWQHQFPDSPINSSGHQDNNPDETVKVVSQRGGVADPARWGYVWKDDHWEGC